VNAVRGVAAGFVVLVLVLATVSGLSGGPGADIVASIWDAVLTALRWAASQLVRLSTATGTRSNGVRALVAAVIVFAALVLTVPYFRRGGTSLYVLVLLAAALGFVLYNPAILPVA
jgi:hypothetical protein